MAAINGPQSINIVQGPQGLSGPNFTRGARGAEQPSASPAATSDQLDISPAAAQAADAADDGIRSDLVAQIREQIANGTYETPERVDAAVSRLLDEIG